MIMGWYLDALKLVFCVTEGLSVPYEFILRCLPLICYAITSFTDAAHDCVFHKCRWLVATYFSNFVC